MLVGAHRSRIHIEVGVELLNSDLQSPALEKRTNRRRGQSFPEGGNDTASDKNVLHYRGVRGW